MNKLSKVVVDGFGYYIDEGLFDSVNEAVSSREQAVSNEQRILDFCSDENLKSKRKLLLFSFILFRIFGSSQSS